MYKTPPLDQKYKKTECEADHATPSVINLPIKVDIQSGLVMPVKVHCIFIKKNM